MSAHVYPPDRDPELRRTFALDSAQQIAELRRLTGDSVSPQGPSSVPFQPIGVTLKETPRGALSCVPQPFPAHVLLEPNASELCILVDHQLFWMQRRHAPRKPDGIAELRADLDTILPHRGIMRIPCRPPRGWTLRDLRDVMARMADAVPRTGADLAASPDVRISWYRDEVIEIEVCVEDKWDTFVTKLRLTPAAGVAVIALVAKFQLKSPRDKSLWTRLAAIDAVVNQSEATSERRMLDDDGDDDDGCDDDLERLARRTLRGPAESERPATAGEIAGDLLVHFRRLSVQQQYLVLRVVKSYADGGVEE